MESTNVEIKTSIVTYTSGRKTVELQVVNTDKTLVIENLLTRVGVATEIKKFCDDNNASHLFKVVRDTALEGIGLYTRF